MLYIAASRWQTGFAMALPLLVTISFSHYCEKARWALDHAGIAYRESGHLPLFHVPAVRRAGGRRQVPVLVTDGGIVEDSTAITQWASFRASPERRLYGDDEAERRTIEGLEERFDEGLGPHARRWIYLYILPNRPLFLRLTEHGVPPLEQRLFPLILPAARVLMRRAMNITPEGARRSEKRIDEIFDEVGRLVSDGRRFLVGKKPSAADIAFASLAAPALLPPEYGFPFPPLEAVPAEVAARVRAWREHPAGRFALGFYAEHRAARRT
jgi:glutathione S-transferase